LSIRRDTSPIELAAIISERLEAAGVAAVLSGGAAISIYTNNRYRSFDLDFVTNASVSTIATVLAPLGFERSKDRYFTHPDTDFYVEFPPGPPAVGGTVIREWTKLETPYGAIQILSPTQMVMDRLAAFIHWNDPQALDQAVMVARDHSPEWPALEAWASREGAPEKYEAFKRALNRI
jgi:hypothetical protein